MGTRAGALLVAASVAACVPHAYSQSLQRYAYSQPFMGTEFTIVLYAADSTHASQAAMEAFARVDSLNGRLSDYLSESELSRLSASAGSGQSVTVSTELYAVLQYSQRVSTETAGAFDVTVGPLTRLWRWAWRRGELPPADAFQAARENVGYQYVRLDSLRRGVRLLREGMRLDLGGIAKGYAADEALRVLQAHGITRALVDAGGDIVLGESPPARSGWPVQVTTRGAQDEPVRETRMFARCAVATSGAIFRYIEYDGVRHSHILDPRTGQSVPANRLVTVVAPTGMAADALASALSVMDPDDAVQFVDGRPGTAVRVLSRWGAALRLDESSRFATLSARVGIRSTPQSQ